jgi:hypothetical protein
MFRLAKVFPIRATALVTLFITLGLVFILPSELFRVAANNVLLLVSVAVAVCFFPASARALKSKHPLRDFEELGLGIEGTWLAVLLLLLYRRSAPILDVPDTMDAIINGVLGWLLIYGGALHVTSPAVRSDKIGRWPLIWLAVAIGIAVSAMVTIIRAVHGLPSV